MRHKSYHSMFIYYVMLYVHDIEAIMQKFETSSQLTLMTKIVASILIWYEFQLSSSQMFI